jgi:hypothetical protein
VAVDDNFVGVEADLLLNSFGVAAEDDAHGVDPAVPEGGQQVLEEGPVSPGEQSLVFAHAGRGAGGEDDACDVVHAEQSAISGQRSVQSGAGENLPQRRPGFAAVATVEFTA